MNPQLWQEQRIKFLARAFETAKIEVADLLLAQQQTKTKLAKIERRLDIAKKKL